jgi:mannose-1-phosphate guanylyltransferase
MRDETMREMSRQPARRGVLDRGTTAGILFPAHWVFRRDPDATMAVFPSDHFVLGSRCSWSISHTWPRG